MEFSKQEYWSGLPFPSPGDLPNPETERGSPALQVNSSPCIDINTIGNTSFKNKWQFYKLNKQYETHISLPLFFSFFSDQ